MKFYFYDSFLFLFAITDETGARQRLESLELLIRPEAQIRLGRWCEAPDVVLGGLLGELQPEGP